MTDYEDLCKRLRGSANFLDKAGFTGFPLIAKDCRESADALAALREQVAAKDADIAAIRELMNVYNLGGWTDAIAPMQRALAAEADNAALRPLLSALRHIDWMQIILNQSAPCCHIEDDGRFCGRAEKWAGHEHFHKFISLEAAIDAAMREGKG